MSLLDLFRRGKTPDGTIRVHLVLKGRTAAGWYDFDEQLTLPAGTTLAGLVEVARGRGIPLDEALATSPHLAHTLMLNGERTPLDDHGDRALAEGDQIYLLAPFAGG